MRKVYTGLFGLVAVIAVAAGTAYAVFNSSVEVSAMEWNVGEANLEIRPDILGFPYSTSLVLPEGTFSTLIPGQSDWGRFFLRNVSESSDVDPLILDLSAQLTEFDEESDWELLKDVLVCVVYEDGETEYDEASETSTGWLSLNEWNTTEAGIPLPGGPLEPEEEVALIFRCGLVPEADNSVAGATVSGIKFVITGDQELTDPEVPEGLVEEEVLED